MVVVDGPKPAVTTATTALRWCTVLYLAVQEEDTGEPTDGVRRPLLLLGTAAVKSSSSTIRKKETQQHLSNNGGDRETREL